MNTREKMINHIMIYVVSILLAAIPAMCLVEWQSGGGEAKLFYVMLVCAIIGIAGFFIIYYRKPESVLIRYILAAYYGFTYLGWLLFTDDLMIISSAFIASSTVIIYHDIKLTRAVIASLSFGTTTVAVIRVVMDRSEPYELVLIIMVLIIYALIWDFVNKTQTKFAAMDTEQIEQQKKEQVEKITFLSEASSKMEQAIKNVESLANNLKQAMTESTYAIQNISESTNDTAESIQQQTLLTETINDATEEILKIAETFSQQINQSVTSSEVGKNKMDTLSEMTDVVVVHSKNITDRMKQFEHNVENIKGITETIQHVASSTNLLALNASIEAARAGEAGSGFAVVADEIGKLAEETRQSTVKIDEMLNEFLEEIGGISEIVINNAEKMDEEAKLVVEAEKNFEEIAECLHKAALTSKEFAEKCEELSVSNNGIKEHILNLSAMSEEVAAQSDKTVEIQRSNSSTSEEIAEELTVLLEMAEKIKA
ncbi:MAG: methyl-accepting chemotaxis protein [bacterium]|nr:methyl-accepting chemotaxis protein [bacterium]